MQNECRSILILVTVGREFFFLLESNLLHYWSVADARWIAIEISKRCAACEVGRVNDFIFRQTECELVVSVFMT